MSSMIVIIFDDAIVNEASFHHHDTDVIIHATIGYRRPLRPDHPSMPARYSPLSFH